jgi:cytochrome c553
MKRDLIVWTGSMTVASPALRGLALGGLLAALTFATPALAGGDATAGQTKSAVCAACHGPGGNAPISPEYPKLAGQHDDYLRNALHDYQKGARKDPVMSAQAANLTPQDILDLAAYFSSQAGSLAVKY